jgi:transposase
MTARLLKGIFFVLRTGIPWHDLPERYGPCTMIYNRFDRWVRAGVWERLFETLAARWPHSLHLIDSSVIRAHQHAAGGKMEAAAKLAPAPGEAVRRSLLGTGLIDLVYKIDRPKAVPVSDIHAEGPGDLLGQGGIGVDRVNAAMSMTRAPAAGRHPCPYQAASWVSAALLHASQLSMSRAHRLASPVWFRDHAPARAFITAAWMKG